MTGVQTCALPIYRNRKRSKQSSECEDRKCGDKKREESVLLLCLFLFLFGASITLLVLIKKENVGACVYIIKLHN